MTYRPAIHLIHPQGPPAGLTDADYAAWQDGVRAVMDELRRAGRRVVMRGRDSTVATLLDALQRGDDATAAGLVEHMYEFAAFHLPGPSGRTLAQCAVQAAGRLDAGVRACLPALADSHWDLFEIAGQTEAGAIELRRLHDDARVELHAMERRQPLVQGSVAALRLFDAGGFTAAPVALVPAQDTLASLVSLLEVEYANAPDSWAAYMRRRGSAVLLATIIQQHRQQVMAGRPMPEPAVSLAESALSAEHWLRLDAAFALLEAALGASAGGAGSLVVGLPDGCALGVDVGGGSTSVTLFGSLDELRGWQSRGEARRFVRAWRAGADELFAEDVELLDNLGLDPRADGAAVAVRLEDGAWEDMRTEDIDRVEKACRWAALQISAEAQAA